MSKVRAEFSYCCFPKKPANADEFRICRFRVVEAGEEVEKGEGISAKGYYLPSKQEQRGKIFLMEGTITKSEWGKTIDITLCQEEVKKDKAGIIGYLSSGAIQGIGKALAERIYDTFGDNTLDILDKRPDRITEVSGIGVAKMQKIQEALVMQSGTIREIITLLVPRGISTKTCWAIFKKYGEQSIGVLRERPFTLCEMYGIGFRKADQIAAAAGLNPHDPTRVEEAMIYVLEEMENGGSLFKESGSLCITRSELVEKTQELLNNEEVEISTREISNAGSVLMAKGRLIKKDEYFYRDKAYAAEVAVANEISHLNSGTVVINADLNSLVKETEAELGIELGEDQEKAVKDSLKSFVSIITGGPGTGKTTIIKTILSVYRKLNNKSNVCLLAPTGRAARRLAESTGEPASTIHKELGLGLRVDCDMETTIEAGLVVVDETSMVDIYLAEKLLNACRYVNQIIFVGDVDQLPSVGAGAFLLDMIASRKVQTSRLTHIYRQESMSAIAVNAARIRVGKSTLTYQKDSFEAYETEDDQEAADIIYKLYLKEVSRVGQDNVIMLCPMRKNGRTSVNNMNTILQATLNPLREGQSEISIRRDGIDVHFRIGDPVMTLKNTQAYSNGDTGRIVGTTPEQENVDAKVEVLLDSGVRELFSLDTIDNLALSYATTIHKSQGSEYKVVITTLLKSNYVMAKRNLIYTSITRARDKLIYVGSPKMLQIAIHTETVNTRKTFLAQRIA
mgnify:CR=1 FL=1